MSARPPAIILPDQRQVIHAFGDEAHLLLSGAETNGQYTQWIEVVPPGNGPPPHYHTLEDEWFHVLEGRFAFFANNAWAEVPVGTAAYMPKNSVHTFKNVGDTPGKLLITTAPSGFETFFTRCAEEFAKGSPPDMQRLIEISAEHGIYFTTP